MGRVFWKRGLCGCGLLGNFIIVRCLVSLRGVWLEFRSLRLSWKSWDIIYFIICFIIINIIFFCVVGIRFWLLRVVLRIWVRRRWFSSVCGISCGWNSFLIFLVICWFKYRFIVVVGDFVLVCEGGVFFMN